MTINKSGGSILHFFWNRVFSVVILLLILMKKINAQEFNSITELNGYLSAWSDLSIVNAEQRGCPASFNLASLEVESSLVLSPCNTTSTISFDLTGYYPMIGFFKSSPNHYFLYSLLAANKSSPCVLATFNGKTGELLQILTIDTTLSPLLMQVNIISGSLYLLVSQLSDPTLLSILTIDPMQPRWSLAVKSSVLFVPNYSVLPQGTTLLVRDALTCSEFIPSTNQLLFVIGSVTSAFSTPIWHLLSVSVITGSWFELTLTDPDIFASILLSITALAPTELVLVSSESGAWLIDLALTSSSNNVAVISTRLSSFDGLLARAVESLGCGHMVVTLDLSPMTVPSANISSLPFVILVMYAEPTSLTAVSTPFWVLLILDATRNEIIYTSIDIPPLFLDMLQPTPTVTTVKNYNGQLPGYNLQTGASLIWIGSGFRNETRYSCATNSSNTLAAFINSTMVMCTIPAKLSQDISQDLFSSNYWLSVKLLAEMSFVLYQSRLLVITNSSSMAIYSSSVLRPQIGRMMVSYSVAYGLTPSPVVSEQFEYSSLTTPSGQYVRSSPLQLHDQFNRGSTFIALQILNATLFNPGLTLDTINVLSPIQSILSQTNWPGSIGISDAYVLFAMAAKSGASDFNNMFLSSSGMISQDVSSLPQVLTGLSTGGATSLSLDLVAMQAQNTLNTIVQTRTSFSLISLLELGAILPPVSSSLLIQLSSLSLNSLLQVSNSNPLLGKVLSNSAVSPSLNLPNNIDAIVNNPAALISAFMPSGAIKDTAITLAQEDFAQFAGGLAVNVQSMITNVGHAASATFTANPRFGSTISTLGNDLAKVGAAISGSGTGLAKLTGPIASLAGLVASAFGASGLIQQEVVSGVSLAIGIGELFAGDWGDGISSIISGIGSLLGFSSGPDETQQLASQIASDFNQVLSGLSTISNQVAADTNEVLSDLSKLQYNLLAADQELSDEINNGFTQLGDLTITGLTQLQNAQYAYYQSEMKVLSGILEALQSNSINQAALSSQLQLLLQFVGSNEFNTLKGTRTSVLLALEAYTDRVYTSISAGFEPSNSLLVRSLTSSYLQSYQESMHGVCTWAIGQNDAADSSMAGNPTSSQTLAQQIQISPFYDLLFALLPSIISEYLNKPLPSILHGSTTYLPNPLSWAYATNFWLEARQAALQSDVADPNCASNLLKAGTQLQVTVRLAVAPSTLLAALANLNDASNEVLNYLNISLGQNMPTLSELSNTITGLNVANSPFAAFDDACAVAMLLLTIGRAAGLSSNGFSNGFVITGIAYESLDPSISFQPGASSTKLFPFAPVLSTSQLAFYLTKSLSALNAAPTAIFSLGIVVNQIQILLLWTSNSMQNAINTFYPPCENPPLTVSQSLPLIDTTVRRIIGYMMQTQTSFIYQGHSVPIFAPPSPIEIVIISSQDSGSSSSTNVAAIIGGVVGGVVFIVILFLLCICYSRSFTPSSAPMVEIVGNP